MRVKRISNEKAYLVWLWSNYVSFIIGYAFALWLGLSGDFFAALIVSMLGLVRFLEIASGYKCVPKYIFVESENIFFLFFNEEIMPVPVKDYVIIFSTSRQEDSKVALYSNDNYLMLLHIKDDGLSHKFHVGKIVKAELMECFDQYGIPYEDGARSLHA
jgi:hypothetical protein